LKGARKGRRGVFNRLEYSPKVDFALTAFYEVRFRIRRHSKRHIFLSAAHDVLVTP